MLFNADKGKVMHVGYNNKQAEYDMNDIYMEFVTVHLFTHSSIVCD